MPFIHDNALISKVGIVNALKISRILEDQSQQAWLEALAFVSSSSRIAQMTL
jgi:hypothetical protein